MSSFSLLSARPSTPVLFLVVVSSACHAPETAPLDANGLTRAVAARDASPEELSAALELAGLMPLSLAAPTAEDLRDPARREFWHACTWAWSPATRAARRRMQTARALAGSAGTPEPIEGALELRELDDPDEHARIMIGFDMIGLLGLGPKASARALADAEARAALDALEEALWNARFDVDAARARLAVLRAVGAALEELLQEAQEVEERIAILDRNGRIPAGALAAARLARRRLDERLARLAIEEASAREALALAAGLAPEASVLDAPADALLDVLLDAENCERTVGEPSAQDLLQRVPRLRGLLLEYAIAEARLRDEAARRWPGLRLGPHLSWEPNFLLGALMASSVPWPGSLEGRIEAASIEREAARERVEDGLLAVQTELSAAREREVAARATLDSGAQPAADESARLWTAARARFAVEPAALEVWAHALEKRAESLHALELARAEVALAALALERSAGPGPDVPRLVAAPLRASVQTGDRP